ncbi:hypothetical protein BYT27DRAFT_7245891 [Phlegmacium glaucopus]|nr:hypothetical protein BYT27DRAFT_7245891 [Phlegmacium glaucopus]
MTYQRDPSSGMGLTIVDDKDILSAGNEANDASHKGNLKIQAAQDLIRIRQAYDDSSVHGRLCRIVDELHYEEVIDHFHSSKSGTKTRRAKELKRRVSKAHTVVKDVGDLDKYFHYRYRYLPWDKVVQNQFKPVQNWFSDFWPIQNQNQNQMAGGEPEPEPNQNRGSVQLVLVLWTGSEPNFGIPT